MEILKELRKMREERQADVAALLGVSQQTYANYENGKHEPGYDTLSILANHFGVSVDFLLGRDGSASPGATRIPVLGHVAAGIPITAVTDILDYEEIPNEMARHGEYFALAIKGKSMEPRMHEGDVVIIRQQESVDDGDVAVVMVNGSDATVKRIRKSRDGLMLIPFNPAFDPIFYSNEDITTLPVRIIGKVVELRAKF